jgi:hypothetical protein
MLGYAVWAVLFVLAWLKQGLLAAVIFMVIYMGVTLLVELLIIPIEGVLANLLFFDLFHMWHGELDLSPSETRLSTQIGIEAVHARKVKRMAYKLAVGRAFGRVGLTVLALWLAGVAHLNQPLQELMGIAMAVAVLLSYLDKYGTNMARTWLEWALGLVGVWVGVAIAG